MPGGLIKPPKMGFGVPMGAWLRTELRELSWDVLTDATARSRGLFRPEAVAGMLRQHNAGRDHAGRLWTLIQFELWHRMFIDNVPERNTAGVAAAGEAAAGDTERPAS